MPTIECCGSTLFYELTGAGAPVLLVHSSACRGGFWRGLIDQLGDGFACYTPDLAGYGRSHCASMGDKSSLRDEADFIAPLLWHDTQRFHLIGHSFGGAVALAAALAWPERVRSLALYEPTAFSLLRGGDSEDRRLFETVTRVAAEMTEFRNAGADDRAMGCFVDFWHGAPVWAAKPAAERARLSPLAGKVIKDFRVLFEASFEASRTRDVQFPVLILRGETSPPVAGRVAEILAGSIGTARLRTIAGAGHMAPVTGPRAIAAAIQDHILEAALPSAEAVTTRNAATDAARSPARTIAPQHEFQHTGETSW
jgi:pimeloyl-ACP methyl ester carboxylesterase